MSRATRLNTRVGSFDVPTVITPAQYGAKGDGSTNDATALQNFLDAAAAGGKWGYLEPGKTYLTNSQLNLSVTQPTWLIGHVSSTIKAGATMTAVISKAAGAVSNIGLANVNIDGDMKAGRAVAIEQAHRPYIDGGIWTNYTARGLALGEAGGQVYEAEIRRVRIWGIDESRGGASPASKPGYGYTIGAAATDNLFEHLEVKNVDIGVEDAGNCNLHRAVHVFGFPVALTNGGTDYVGTAGFSLIGFNSILQGCYADTQFVGVRVSGEGNQIVGCRFMWLSQWVPSTTVLGIDILAGATYTLISGNHMSIRPSATFTGLALRIASGSSTTNYIGNSHSGAFTGGNISGLIQENNASGNDTILGNTWSGGRVQDVRPNYTSNSGVSGAVTIDAQTGKHFVYFMTGNITSTTISNGSNGMELTIMYAQDATGGRTYAWPTNCCFTQGAAPNDTTPNTSTNVTFFYSGGQWRERARSVAVPSNGSTTGSNGIPALSGQYFYPISGASTGTSNTLGNGTLRLTPFHLLRAITVTKLGGDVATVGEAGSKFRLGIYADTGSLYPGALLVDAGQIAGDSATMQEITLGTPLALAPGWYWVGGAVQSAPTTQPTMRTINNSTVGTSILPIGTTIPASNGTVVGYSQASVTAALPATFSATVSAISSAARLFAKAA